MKKGSVISTFSAQYTLMSQLGAGGAGEVYLAADQENKRVSIKFLTNISTTKRKRFRNETEFCAKFLHKNIIRVLDYGAYQVGNKVAIPFYVMDYYDQTLRKKMEKGIAPKDIPGLFKQMLDGVEAAHLMNIWHRDLKPENILVDKNNHLVVADFGIAHFAEEYLCTSIKTGNNDRLANARYAAPEQSEPGQEVKSAADIYALGLILNEMFTGKLARGSSYAKIGDSIPDFGYFDDVVDSMISQNPLKRPESIQQVRTAIAKSNELFYQAQKVSQISQQVVPNDFLEDPRISTPTKVDDIHIAEDNYLVITVNHQFDQKWLEALDHTVTSYIRSPREFRFRGNQATIRFAAEREAEIIVSHFRDWLPVADAYYVNIVRREHFEEQERKRSEFELARKREKELLEKLARHNILREKLLAVQS